MCLFQLLYFEIKFLYKNIDVFIANSLTMFQYIVNQKLKSSKRQENFSHKWILKNRMYYLNQDLTNIWREKSKMIILESYYRHLIINVKNLIMNEYQQQNVILWLPLFMILPFFIHWMTTGSNSFGAEIAWHWISISFLYESCIKFIIKRVPTSRKIGGAEKQLVTWNKISEL